MIKTSEWVSLGHPDKIADYISSYLLDEYLRHDPEVRYAVEVQVKGNVVNLAGEVTSTWHPDDLTLKRTVKKAVAGIGYTHYYSTLWGAENTMDASALVVNSWIGEQSPDIARGVDRNGWGDQGIFWGMACDETEGLMPRDIALAERIGRKIYRLAYTEPERGIGLDIKTQVTTGGGGNVLQLIVAAPCMTSDAEQTVRNLVRSESGYRGEDVIVNGTGRYVRHAAFGDCGTTGRKLAVDFYGGNCRIGGGSPWTKDGSKADVALNLYARFEAVRWLMTTGGGTVFCSISCCIGREEIRETYYDTAMRQLGTYVNTFGVKDAAEVLDLRRPIYAELCRDGLFSRIKRPVLKMPNWRSVVQRAFPEASQG